MASHEGIPRSEDSDSDEEFFRIMSKTYNENHPLAIEISEETGFHVGVVETAADLSPEEGAKAAAMGAIAAFKSLPPQEQIRRRIEAESHHTEAASNKDDE